MYKEIEEFLEFLRKETAKPLIEVADDKDNSFAIKPYAEFAPEGYDCEIAKVFAGSDDVIDVLKRVYNQEYFEMQHPFIDSVISRGIKRFKCSNDYYEVIFMIDKNNTFPWILVILHDMACVATDKGFFHADIFGHGLFFDEKGDIHQKIVIRNCIAEALVNLNAGDIAYRDIKFIPSIYVNRPDHFFFDALQFALVCGIKKVKNEKLFFKPKTMEVYDGSERIMIGMRIRYIYHRYQNSQLIDWQNIIIDDALNGYDSIVRSSMNYDLVIWLGIPGERRLWLEQYEGISQILKNIAKCFPKIKVYIDGMTAYDGENIEVKDNQVVFNKIKNEVDKLELDIDLESLSGYDYRSKICYGNTCDIYIGDVGTTHMVMCKILKKPAVLFAYHSEMLDPKTQFLVNYDNLIYFNLDYLVSRKFSAWRYNIHLPWQHLYNLSADILEKIKNIKMHRLDVPPVELLVLRARVNTLSAEMNRLKAGNVNSLTATDRIQNYLSYKLGRLMIENSKSIFGWIKMPFSIISTIKEHKLLTKLTNKITKLPKIETLPDYKEALKYKNHMSYKLGEAFLKINKNWHKGGPIWFIFEIIRINKKRK